MVICSWRSQLASAPTPSCLIESGYNVAPFRSVLKIFISACVVPEDCENGVDDDGNGLTDCEDYACGWTEAYFVEGPEVCDDGQDNDLDGAYDCEDPDCFDSCWIY